MQFPRIDFFFGQKLFPGFPGKNTVEDRAAEKTRDIERHVHLTVNARWLSYWQKHWFTFW